MNSSISKNLVSWNQESQRFLDISHNQADVENLKNLSASQMLLGTINSSNPASVGLEENGLFFEQSGMAENTNDVMLMNGFGQSDIIDNGMDDSGGNKHDRDSELECDDDDDDMKDNRKRYRLTPDQTRRLLEIFEKTSKPDSEMRKALGKELNMPSRKVQIWFQNRRAKIKREKGGADLFSGFPYNTQGNFMGFNARFPYQYGGSRHVDGMMMGNVGLASQVGNGEHMNTLHLNDGMCIPETLEAPNHFHTNIRTFAMPEKVDFLSNPLHPVEQMGINSLRVGINDSTSAGSQVELMRNYFSAHDEFDSTQNPSVHNGEVFGYSQHITADLGINHNKGGVMNIDMDNNIAPISYTSLNHINGLDMYAENQQYPYQLPKSETFGNALFIGDFGENNIGGQSAEEIYLNRKKQLESVMSLNQTRQKKPEDANELTPNIQNAELECKAKAVNNQYFGFNQDSDTLSNSSGKVEPTSRANFDSDAIGNNVLNAITTPLHPFSTSEVAKLDQFTGSTIGSHSQTDLYMFGANPSNFGNRLDVTGGFQDINKRSDINKVINSGHAEDIAFEGGNLYSGGNDWVKYGGESSNEAIPNVLSNINFSNVSQTLGNNGIYNEHGYGGTSTSNIFSIISPSDPTFQHKDVFINLPNGFDGGINRELGTSGIDMSGVSPVSIERQNFDINKNYISGKGLGVVNNINSVSFERLVGDGLEN
ncbi:Retinal homeobox protein Rx [Zancudomyces culisetae]|uniref:Retinal homeobox protein Rx n=1 Tax=Zancudomyces culisetae TaxID=1213189 RepID=A0A1R1PXQ3_ZANCU|nr:Retinal homeobox protein Rx [Zancudomyces culisetae]|eukprot:OMH85754.1 Retinal homeobox protein Rx [Zancudomyces culisetae]